MACRGTVECPLHIRPLNLDKNSKRSLPRMWIVFNNRNNSADADSNHIMQMRISKNDNGGIL
jgi:hypothetical protein